MKVFTTYQKAVGKCPKCKRFPTWFNDVPLRAFCWGPTKKEHEECSRVVPSPEQPYGTTHNTPWIIRKQFTVLEEIQHG
jgi:hypothetical protein